MFPKELTLLLEMPTLLLEGLTLLLELLKMLELLGLK
jgi:hypothetical protein